MRRILAVLAIAAATFLSVLSGPAIAQTGYLYTEVNIDGPVQITPCISGYFQLLIDDYDGVSVFYMNGDDHCSDNHEVFSLWVRPPRSTTDIDFYTNGLSINTRLDGTDVDHAKQYDVWVNLQIKCVGTIGRYHPGSSCGGPVTGRIAFGKYAVAPNASDQGSMDWRYWTGRLP